MKKTLFIVFFCSLFSACFSQKSFIKLLYNNNALAVHDATRLICKSHDGNYIVTSYGFYNSTGNYLIFKVDTTGNVIWTQKIGPLNGEPSDIQLTVDKGFILTGHCHGLGSNRDVLILKTDSNGVFQWSKNIRSNNGSEGIALTSTKDSCFIITGFIYSDTVLFSEIPLIKIDNYGNLIWSKTIGLTQSDEKAYSIKMLHNNDFIIAGVTIKYDSLHHPISRDALIIKIDSIGQVQWSKTYPFGEARDIIETNDFGLAFTGITEDSLSYNVSFVKLDSYGNIIFSKSIGSNTFDDYGICLQQKNNGFFLIAGADYDNNISSSNIFMIELNQNGDKIWSNNYFYYSTMAGFYGPSFIVDGCRIFMGGIKNDNAPVNSYPYIFKLDTSGFSCQMSSYSPDINQANLQMHNIILDESKGDTLYPAIINCSAFSPIENTLCTTPGITEELIFNDNIYLYPNPSLENINIETSENSIIEISNSNGQVIKTMFSINKVTSIDLTNFVSGIYIIKSKSAKGITINKFIKQ